MEEKKKMKKTNYTDKEEQGLWKLFSSMLGENIKLFLTITEKRGLPNGCITTNRYGNGYKWNDIIYVMKTKEFYKYVNINNLHGGTIGKKIKLIKKNN